MPSDDGVQAPTLKVMVGSLARWWHVLLTLSKPCIVGDDMANLCCYRWQDASSTQMYSGKKQTFSLSTSIQYGQIFIFMPQVFLLLICITTVMMVYVAKMHVTCYILVVCLNTSFPDFNGSSFQLEISTSFCGHVAAVFACAKKLFVLCYTIVLLTMSRTVMADVASVLKCG